MKEIRAFIHDHRVAGVIEALSERGFLDLDNPRRCRNLNIANTQSLLSAVDTQEQHYSMKLGRPVINEAKLELLCEDEQTDELVALIAAAAQTGQDEAGWVYVTDVITAVQVKGHTASTDKNQAPGS